MNGIFTYMKAIQKSAIHVGTGKYTHPMDPMGMEDLRMRGFDGWLFSLTFRNPENIERLFPRLRKTNCLSRQENNKNQPSESG